MAIVIKRKDNENVSSFLYRASGHIKQSGILLSARKKRFRRSKPNKTQRKKSALHKIKVINEVYRMQRLGLPIKKKSRKR